VDSAIFEIYIVFFAIYQHLKKIYKLPMKKTLLINFFLLLSSAIGQEISDFEKLASKGVKGPESTYTAYAASYGQYNLSQQNARVPIFRTNAHHRAVKFMLLMFLKNRSNFGLPILHMDSHPDLGFAPVHGITEVTKANIEKIDSRLTDVSQVLLPVMQFGLSHEFHMCMPPWYTRTPLDNKKIPFSLVEFNKANFVGATVNRLYPVTKIKNDFMASPFFHSKKYKSNQLGTIQFLNCFSKEKLKIKQNYILSLDLDIISTNGEKHNHARPISFSRSQKGERDEIKKRVKWILKRIRDLKKRGVRPVMISISDSTSYGGGGFTPVGVAYF
jgi:hypothetical protein